MMLSKPQECMLCQTGFDNPSNDIRFCPVSYFIRIMLFMYVCMHMYVYVCMYYCVYTLCVGKYYVSGCTCYNHTCYADRFIDRFLFIVTLCMYVCMYVCIAVLCDGLLC